MKNIANADRPKSAGAMLPPRPLRRSGKVAQTACNSDRREGKSCIPTLNQTFADSRILKISQNFLLLELLACLALNFGQLGLRVLLIDGDMRNPSIHKMLKLDNGEGLSNYLSGATPPGMSNLVEG